MFHYYINAFFQVNLFPETRVYEKVIRVILNGINLVRKISSARINDYTENISKNMSINNCRVCGHKFFDKSLLRYENMPKSAQFLPEKEALENDKGIILEVYQCSGCGLVQLNSDPVPYYKEVIRAAAVSVEMKDFRRKQFADFIKKYSLNGKSVIEIGCGRGEYLSLIQQCDVKAYGLENSQESVSYGEKNGLRISKGFVQENTQLNNALFNAFFMLNFLEHLPDPNAVLTGIYNNLSDSAVGLVEVPNFNMILQKNLFSEFISDHLFYFTKETLNNVLKLNGFEIIENNIVWHNYIISTVVKKRKKLNISHFYNSQTKIEKEIKEYLSRFRDKKVAIWGAGHQALTIISLIGLTDKIRYVVDSAVFKQGKYTPATHLPIVAPIALDTDPVEAIIIMVASYSDEIVKTLRHKFGKKINLAVLRADGLEQCSR